MGLSHLLLVTRVKIPKDIKASMKPRWEISMIMVKLGENTTLGRFFRTRRIPVPIMDPYK